MSKNLFKDFSKVSAKQWKQTIQYDLKGLDYNETLLSPSEEGIVINPFYHHDDFNALTIPQLPSNFEICQTIFVNKVKTARSLAIDALKRGANSIKFIADAPFDVPVLLDAIDKDLEKAPVLYFHFLFLDISFLKQLSGFAKSHQLYLNIDILGNLVKNGNWYHNHKGDHDILRGLSESSLGIHSLFGVDASHYQNSGAHIVQQVAYALSHANEYLNYFGKRIGSVMNFNFAVGGNYFFEVAKFRAFRYLWNLLIQEYGIEVKAHIHAEPSLRNKSLLDYNNNMLRTTSECMSAILGGVQVIHNISYDSFFRRKNEFGERISRNQLIMLQEESNLKNSKFVSGSYYIEQLTYEISEKALTLFKDIEKRGGFLKQLFEGTIQRKIEQNALKQQENFDQNKSILIGVNDFLIEDKMIEPMELFPFLKSKTNETIIQPILAKRLAESIEKEHLANV